MHKKTTQNNDTDNAEIKYRFFDSFETLLIKCIKKVNKKTSQTTPPQEIIEIMTNSIFVVTIIEDNIIKATL